MVRHKLRSSGKAIGLVLKIKDGKFEMVYDILWSDGKQYGRYARDLVKVQDD